MNRRVLIFSTLAACVAGRISGLLMPTCASLHASSGKIYIAEKGGSIKVASNNMSTSANLAMTLAVPNLATQGNLGLTSVLATNGWLYVTYTTFVNTETSECSDTGVNAGIRVASSVLGCPTTGVLARFPLSADGSLSPVATSDILIGGPADVALHRPCAQFTDLGINSVVSGPDGALYVSTGVGAHETTLDVGQYGGDPCSSGIVGAKGGHFRAQDTTSWSGKILRVVVGDAPGSTPAVTVFASGLHDPWRTTWVGSNLVVIDTSGYNTTVEEINYVSAGDNLGWPCRFGLNDEAKSPFYMLNEMSCLRAKASQSNKDPFFTYDHPGTGSVISAIAYHALSNRFVWADYITKKIYSFSAIEVGTTFLTSPSLTVDDITSFCAHLFNMGDQVWSVDVVRGNIEPVAVAAGTVLNPNAPKYVARDTSVPADYDTNMRLGLGLGIGLGVPVVVVFLVAWHYHIKRILGSPISASAALTSASPSIASPTMSAA